MLSLHHDHIIPSLPQKIFSRFYGSCSLIYIAIYRRKKYYLKTGLTSLFNRNLKTMRRFPLRYLRRLPNLSAEEARIWYPTIKRMHLNFCRLYDALEKTHFFKNSFTRELAEEISANYYKAEAAYRRRAFMNVPPNDDQQLKEFASALSLNSLQHVNDL